MSHHNPGADGDAAIKSLRQEIAQLEHELRRVQDGLERNPSHALEQRARQLRANIDLCKGELEAELSARPDRE